MEYNISSSNKVSTKNGVPLDSRVSITKLKKIYIYRHKTEYSSTNQWIAVISVTNRARTKIFSPKYSLKKTYLGRYS